MSSHLYSCHQTDCSNMTTDLGSTCDACREDWHRCPGCGDVGATVLGSKYCHTCMSVRDHPCNKAFIEYPHEHTGRCGWADDGTRICDDDDEFPKTVRVSDELKAELLANLPDKWSFTPAHPPLPPSPPPRHMSLESMRAEIAEIEVRLRGGLTKGQRDDWVWLLQNRRADLAEAEKEMWEGYDQDDLNKLDRANRH